MHLTLREPNTWYMADLQRARLSRSRRHAAGFPLIIAGHNEHVAWGFTALYGDVQDLYIEKLDGKGNYEVPVLREPTRNGIRSPSIAKSFTCAAAKMCRSTFNPPRTARC